MIKNKYNNDIPLIIRWIIDVTEPLDLLIIWAKKMKNTGILPMRILGITIILIYSLLLSILGGAFVGVCLSIPSSIIGLVLGTKGNVCDGVNIIKCHLSIALTGILFLGTVATILFTLLLSKLLLSEDGNHRHKDK